MDVQYILVWRTYPLLKQVYASTVSGRLRKACKRNIRRLDPHFQELLDWIKEDAAEHGWELTGTESIPFDDKDFQRRFSAVLLGEKAEVRPYFFSEELMEHADGITGDQEDMLAWLFIEFKSDEEDKSEEPEEAASDE